MGVYEHDAALPALPVATLESTRADLKRRMQPLLDAGTYADACAEVDRFCAPDGEGPALHRQLLGWRDALPENSSWLRPIWDDSYLAFRGPSPVNMNYALQLAPQSWGAPPLGTLAAALAGAIAAIRNESLPPEATRGGFLSMDTLRAMVHTRIPGAQRDTLFFPPLAEPMAASVACRGHWFILSLTGADGHVLSPAALQAGLEEIRRQAGALPSGDGVGAFTAAPRDEAHALRAEVAGSMQNRLNLESIEKTVFALCLDAPAPDEGTFGALALCRNSTNRWYDKSLQIITDGERIALNIEHSACDAGIWVYLLNQANRIAREGSLPASSTGKACIRRLCWAIPGETAGRLQQAAQAFAAWSGTLTFSQHRLTELNKEAIKARKCSPDAFAQILFQIAHYQLKGCFHSVYEAVSTRGFYAGRTECVRPCTAESAAFILALEAGEPPEVLKEKFYAAAKAHGDNLALCQQGLGSERHMSGLLAASQWAGSPPPAIFGAPGYQTLTHTAISTSSTTAPCIQYFGFCPVVEDGIGIGYGLKSDALHLMVSAYNASGIQPELFIEKVRQAGLRLLALLG